MLGAEMKQRYIEDGFLHVPQFFKARELTAIVDATDALIRERRTSYAYDNTFAQVKLPWSMSAVCSSLTTHSGLGHMVRELCGISELSVFLDRILYKHPGAGHTKPHIDAPFFAFDDARAPACWIALCDTTRDNGAMAYYRASHLTSVPLAALDADGTIPNDSPFLNPQSYCQVEAAAGDIIFHHPHVIHCATSNTSVQIRRAYTIQYMKTGTRYNGENPGFFGDWKPGINEPLNGPCFPRVM